LNKTIKMRLLRLSLLVVAMAVFSFLLYRQAHPIQNAATAEPGNDLVFQVHSISVTNNLALGDFVIPAKGTHDVPITADEGQMRNARLSGYFSTSSGPGIQVMLLDENQYRRFQSNSTPSEYIYLSKPTANGIIDVAIPHSGKYYLVFDNSISESNANVKANVSIRGEMVQVESPPGKKK
jgi:hypothetical protein